MLYLWLELVPNIYTFIHSFNRPIGMCRMRQFLAVLCSFFYSSLLYTFCCHPSPSTSILLFPNSYIILFWEFYYLPFSVHAHTNVIYLTLLSLSQWVFLNNFSLNSSHYFQQVSSIHIYQILVPLTLRNLVYVLEVTEYSSHPKEYMLTYSPVLLQSNTKPYQCCCC